MSQTNGGWQVVGMGLPGGSWSWTTPGGTANSCQPPFICKAPTPNPNKPTTQTKRIACAADVAINYALGFIPGYNAVKFVAAAAGVSFNPVQNVLAGNSAITVGGPSVLGGLNALGSAYYAISLKAAGGIALNDLGKIASSAGTISNLLNTVSAGYDLYQCYQIQ